MAHSTTDEVSRVWRRLGLTALVLVVGGLIAFIISDLGTSSPTGGSAVGPMGGAVVDVPMTRSGSAAAGSIEVDGSQIEMGIVPLDVTVIPSWTLVNTGTEPVVLGEPHASVIDGCCPGPLELGVRTLEPGGSTDLSFPLEMHPGMDGPHQFLVHVPVGTGSDYLELTVIGDFEA